MDWNTFWMIVVLLVIGLQFTVMIRQAKRTPEMRGDGWYDVYCDEYTRIRFYSPDKYWNAHSQGIPDESHIVEGGTFKYDGKCWFRWSPMMTKREYEEQTYEDAKECGCVSCQNIIATYERAHGKP